MKKGMLLGVVVLVVVLVSCVLAPKPLSPEEQSIQEIFEVDKAKNELYRLSLEWVARTFKSAKAVIQYQDKEEGIIIGKGFMFVRYGFGIPYDTYFTLTIETREGKVRATVEDAYWKTEVGDRPLDNVRTMNECFKPEVLKMFESLEEYLKKGTEAW